VLQILFDVNYFMICRLDNSAAAARNSQFAVAVFLSRVSILTRDINIANLSARLSVRYVPVSDENGLKYRHSFFTVR